MSEKDEKDFMTKLSKTLKGKEQLPNASKLCPMLTDNEYFICCGNYNKTPISNQFQMPVPWRKVENLDHIEECQQKKDKETKKKPVHVKKDPKSEKGSSKAASSVSTCPCTKIPYCDNLNCFRKVQIKKPLARSSPSFEETVCTCPKVPLALIRPQPRLPNKCECNVLLKPVGLCGMNSSLDRQQKEGSINKMNIGDDTSEDNRKKEVNILKIPTKPVYQDESTLPSSSKGKGSSEPTQSSTTLKSNISLTPKKPLIDAAEKAAGDICPCCSQTIKKKGVELNVKKKVDFTSDISKEPSTKDSGKNTTSDFTSEGKHDEYETFTAKTPNMYPGGKEIFSRSENDLTETDKGSKKKMKESSKKSSKNKTTVEKKSTIQSSEKQILLQKMEKIMDEEKKTCKSRLRLAFLEGMYPGNRVGHKNCCLPPMLVPKNKGWLWNLCEGSCKTKPGIGWKPGAIRKDVLAILQDAKKKAPRDLFNKYMKEDEDSDNGDRFVPDKSDDKLFSDEDDVSNVEVGQEPIGDEDMVDESCDNFKTRGGFGDHYMESEFYCARIDSPKKPPEREFRPTLHLRKSKGQYFVSMFPEIDKKSKKAGQPVLFSFDRKEFDPDAGPPRSSDETSTVTDDSLEMDYTSAFTMFKNRPPTKHHAQTSMEVKY